MNQTKSMDQHEISVRQFGSTAEKYLASTVHSAGADLERLTERAKAAPDSSMLDLGCGAGHASFALARGGARRIVACDPAAPMLEVVRKEAAARGHPQIETLAGPAERLPCDDESFDCVVTRYSAHHWLDVRRAIQEIGRVLKPGGRIIVIDVLSPENPLFDTALQTVEILRDCSHVRDYRESEWYAMFRAANFSGPTTVRWKLPMQFDAWVARIGTSAARIDALKTVLDELPGEARDYFAVDDDHSFTIDAGWLEGTKEEG
jgi:ubiquinone/menaquinone biosynthesis C-methylase UbiE